MLLWMLFVVFTSVLCSVGVDDFVDDLCDQLAQGRPQYGIYQKINDHLGDQTLYFDALFSKLKVRSLRDFVQSSNRLASDPWIKKKDILEPLKVEIARACERLCESQEACHKEQLRELLNKITQRAQFQF